MKIDNLTLEELKSFALSLGEKAFRGSQLYKWMYSKNVFDFDKMTDLSKDFRENLKEKCDFTHIKIKNYQISEKDGSVKFLFELEDNHFIESVILKDTDRYTACISTQVGCRMGCTFCNTAKIGFLRNLNTAEILKQVIFLNKYLLEKENKKLTNLVFMGMGEPLDNYDNLVRALEILLDDNALNFSHRKITVSTCGLMDKLMELSESPVSVNLAISLNAADDSTRSKLMPVNYKYPINTIVKNIKGINLRKGRRITIEYVMFKGVNDRKEDAEKLVKILKGLPIKLNLIPYNKTEDVDFFPPDEKNLFDFQNILINANISCFIRKSLGDDIEGACGQLYANYLKKKAVI
jgi:23S rRNA (adenine2503-C2)-methyltransferase